MSPDRPVWRTVNRWFLAFSRVFGVFGAMSIEEREALNAVVLRRVIAVGYAMGAVTMGGAGIFVGDRVGPTAGIWLAAGAFASLSVVAMFGRSLPPLVVRIMAFDITVLLLCVIVGIGYEPAYIALLYFGWPALTAAHFGTVGDFTRTMLLMLVGLPIALVFSDVSVPLLAYGGVLAVSGFSALVVRAIVFQAMQLFRELDHIASTDALTGLLNRRAATAALGEAVARAQRQNTELSVVIFDIDHFKRINDSLGHPAGDTALQRFAEVLLATCSSTDVAARLGGEEFLVVLLRSGESGSRAFAERFSDALDYETANDEAPLSVSAGVAALDEERADADSLLVAADRALYAAKRSGRHRVIAASDAGVGPLSPPLVRRPGCGAGVADQDHRALDRGRVPRERRSRSCTAERRRPRVSPPKRRSAGPRTPPPEVVLALLSRREIPFGQSRLRPLAVAALRGRKIRARASQNYFRR